MQAKSLIQLYLDHSRCTGKIHTFFQSFEAAYRSKTFIFFFVSFHNNFYFPFTEYRIWFHAYW